MAQNLKPRSLILNRAVAATALAGAALTTSVTAKGNPVPRMIAYTGSGRRHKLKLRTRAAAQCRPLRGRRKRRR